jgi:hypothetical protein
MVADRSDIVSSDLTQWDITLILNIIGRQPSAIALCEMVSPNVSIEINPTTAGGEVIKDI